MLDYVEKLVLFWKLVNGNAIWKTERKERGRRALALVCRFRQWPTLMRVQWAGFLA